MRRRDEQLNFNWGTICPPVELIAKDSKKRIGRKVRRKSNYIGKLFTGKENKRIKRVEKILTLCSNTRA